jgi:four helix bundle protein
MIGRNGSDLRDRTRAFALAVIRFVEALPKTQTAAIIGRQLLRSGTSVGANYRAARRARSNADFIAKLGIVEEEIDECAYGLELLQESATVPRERIAPTPKPMNSRRSLSRPSQALNSTKSAARNFRLPTSDFRLQGERWRSTTS